MTIGFRIHPRRNGVAPDILRGFAELPVANVSDSMNRLSAAGPMLRPYHAEGVRLCGPALTVRSRPGDNLLLHKAIDMAEPGEVIVVDAGGDLTNALMGEIMVHLAVSRGIGGFVLNGAIRDIDEIRKTGMPVYAAGVTHRGPYKDGPGEINAPVGIGGMVVRPGDVMLGDGDGVLCVPAEEAQEVLLAAQAKQRAEVEEIAAIHQGRIDRAWVDAQLRTRGCENVN